VLLDKGTQREQIVLVVVYCKQLEPE